MAPLLTFLFVVEDLARVHYNRHAMSDGKRTWFVYLVECADGTLYTGMALDPQRRVNQHNAGRGARYTRTRLPVNLVGSVAVEGRAEALRLERRIKGWSPQRKHAFFAKH